MGGVFARALLRSGVAVYPVLRGRSLEATHDAIPDPGLVFITVGEADLPPVLAGLPHDWKRRVGLLQNELLPRDWLAAGVENPTVAVVWFEKKPGRDVKVIIPTPIGGPSAGLLVEALGRIEIPARVVGDTDEIEYELVRKNLYILTANIAGLVGGGTVMELWSTRRSLAENVAAEVLEIQQWLVGRPLDVVRLMDGMVEAFRADPDHGATGRSAPSRLARALGHAAEAGIDVPTLSAIQQGTMGEPPDQ